MPLIIEKLYAWIAEEDDGSQGIIAYFEMNRAIPLVGPDKARVEAYREFMQDLARQHHKRIFLMEFSSRTILETINEH